MSALSPAYFRIGGNMADMLRFIPKNKTNSYSNHSISFVNFTLSGITIF